MFGPTEICYTKFYLYTCRFVTLSLLHPVTGHNGHKPKRPQPKRPQTETATNRNGHKPKRPQTGTATNRKRPQTETATSVVTRGTQICATEVGQHWSSNGLAPNKRQAITWSSDVLFNSVSSDANMCHKSGGLVQVMVYRLFGTKPLPEPKNYLHQ